MVFPDGISCACVHSDASTCARWRDGVAADEYDYQPRRCECQCHTIIRQEEQDEEDL